MPKKSAKSNQNILYTGLAIFVLACFFSLYKFYMPKAETASVNQVTSGNVPSVSIRVGNSSYTFAYGIGDGFNGNDKGRKMEGVVIGNTFYPWSPTPYNAPSDFNPSKGVMYSSANGQFTTYGGTIIEHNPPLTYLVYGQATISTTNTGTPAKIVKSSPSPTMYYFNKVAKKCFPISSTSSACASEIKKSMPGTTTGKCYNTANECMTASRSLLLGK